MEDRRSLFARSVYHHSIGRVFILIFLIFLTTSNGTSNKSSLESTTTNNSTTTSLPPPQDIIKKEDSQSSVSDVFYIVLIVVLSVIGIVAILAALACWYRHSSLMMAAERVLYRSSDSSVLIRNGTGQNRTQDQDLHLNGAHQLSGLAQRVDYPAYGVTGPNPLHEAPREKPVDGALNRSAEVFHYNQTKKRMKELSSSTTSDSGSKINESLDVSAELELNDEETSDGEYTVYECSGFAAAMDGPMEIRNPLFDDVPASKQQSDDTLEKEANGSRTNPLFQNN